MAVASLGHFVVRSLSGEPSRISENRSVGDAEWLARGQIEIITHALPHWENTASNKVPRCANDPAERSDLASMIGADVIRLLITHLPTARDHCVLASVCHRWRDAVLHRQTLLLPAPAIPTTAKATPSPISYDSDASLTVASFAAIISKLHDLTAVDLSGRHAICSEGALALGVLAASCPLLRELRLRDCTLGDAGLLALTPCWPQLAILDVAGNPALTGAALLPFLAAASHLVELAMTAGNGVHLDILGAAIRAASGADRPCQSGVASAVVPEQVLTQAATPQRPTDEGCAALRSLELELVGARAPAVVAFLRNCSGLVRLVLHGRVSAGSWTSAELNSPPAGDPRTATPFALARLESLEWGVWGPDAGLVSAVIDSSPNLRRLTIFPTTAAEPLQVAARLHGLTELRLREARIDDAALVAMIERLGEQLTVVEVSSLRLLRPETVAALLTRCTAAREMRITGVQGRFPPAFAVGCTGATTLALIPCCGASAEPVALADLGRIVSACPGLQRLELPYMGKGGFRRGGEAPFVAFVDQLPPCLTALDLSGWCELGDGTAAALVARCPNLCEVWLWVATMSAVVGGVGLGIFGVILTCEFLFPHDTPISPPTLAAIPRRYIPLGMRPILSS